jgi:hypothetical protein
MTTSVQIVNQGLMQLGAEPIDAIGDDSDMGRLAAHNYPNIKRSILRSYPWNCATRRKDLPLLSEAPLNEYAHQHQLPDDCLRVLAAYAGDYRLRYDSQYEMPAYQREGNRLLSDSSSVAIKYIADIIEPEMDAHVEMALVARVAAEFCYAATGSNSAVGNFFNLADAKLNEARTTDSLEQPHSRTETYRLKVVRY